MWLGWAGLGWDGAEHGKLEGCEAECRRLEEDLSASVAALAAAQAELSQREAAHRAAVQPMEGELARLQAAVAASQAAASVGANWVQLETTWFLSQCSSTVIAPIDSVTPTDIALSEMVRYAHSLGVQVMLNTHIELSCVYNNSCENNCTSRTKIDFGVMPVTSAMC